MGVWIEATGDTDFLIRDIATGEKSGFEVDSNHFKSNANWWFWGDINSAFHLDAEISVWDFDRTMFQANSYGANIPDVTVGDGIQSFLGMFYSLPFNANDGGVGSLNKIGLNVAFPWVEALFGYGTLKANGMSEFTGIYNVIDRWQDVGKGFTELRLGKDLKNLGDFKLNAVAALSQMRGTYGVYDILDIGYKNSARVVFTYGSKTTAEELFYYNEADLNAVSAYLCVSPVDSFKAELHGIGTFGHDVTFGANSLAGAVRLSYLSDNFKLAVKESYAGEDAHSVWGSDGQAYDNINADNLVTGLDINWHTPFEPLTFLTDLSFMMNDVDNLSEGLMSVRVQPIFDMDFNNLLNSDISVSAYGVLDVERLALATSAERNVVPYLEEAGIEFVLTDVFPFMKKLTGDYACKLDYNDWNSESGLTNNVFYNSIMLNADISDTLNVHAGSVIRLYHEKEATQVPFGFAIGAKFNNLPLPGHPAFWTHFCYAMNPYEDNNYSLYRADDPQNKAAHRTYLLNTLDGGMTKSQISLGFIWSL